MLSRAKEEITSYDTSCHIVAATLILLASSLGSSIPLVSKYYPPLQVPYSFFVVAKSFGTGVILGVGLIHLLGPAQQQLSVTGISLLSSSASGSTAFWICLISVLLMHTIEAVVSRLYTTSVGDESMMSPLIPTTPVHHHGHHHASTVVGTEDSLRARISAVMMGFGTSFHSLFIGFSLGTCEDAQLVVLTIALCLHQFFEGLALGTKLVESPITFTYECLMAASFVVSAPLTAYFSVWAMHFIPNHESVTAFALTQGITDACCAGILLYLGFGLLHNDFFADMHLIVDETGNSRYDVHWGIHLARLYTASKTKDKNIYIKSSMIFSDFFLTECSSRLAMGLTRSKITNLERIISTYDNSLLFCLFVCVPQHCMLVRAHVEKYFCSGSDTVREVPLGLAITELRCVGSHNSGTYGIEESASIAPDAPSIFSGVCSCFTRRLLRKLTVSWATCQRKTILEQLENGIRYLDLRVIPNNENQKLVTTHGVYAAPLDDIIQDILRFFTNPVSRNEFIILDFQHVFCTPEYMEEQFFPQLEALLPLCVLRSTGLTRSLQELIEADPKRRLFIFLGCSFNEKCYTEIFPRSAFLESSWKDATTVQSLLGSFNDDISKVFHNPRTDPDSELANGPPPTINVTQAIITADAGVLFRDCLSECCSPFDLPLERIARRVNHKALQWFCYWNSHQMLEGRDIPRAFGVHRNVLLLDFPEVGHLCSQADREEIVMNAVGWCIVLNLYSVVKGVISVFASFFCYYLYFAAVSKLPSIPINRAGTGTFGCCFTCLFVLPCVWRLARIYASLFLLYFISFFYLFLLNASPDSFSPAMMMDKALSVPSAKLSSDKVKMVDIHPDEPIFITACYSGIVNLWNYETQKLIKTFDTGRGTPTRCARFIPRLQSFVCGSDDNHLRVFNYHTMERTHIFRAHDDFVRTIAVHDQLPIVITGSDNGAIHQWDWSENWALKCAYDGHTEHCMDISFNPTNSSSFATASLDCSICVWTINDPVANYELLGHEEGVTCLQYYPRGDKPYLLSGSDDLTARLWDYQSKACLHVFSLGSSCITAVVFSPDRPVFFVLSQCGYLHKLLLDTFALDMMVGGWAQSWTLAARSNILIVGHDTGVIIYKLGDKPVFSMDNNGKVVVAENNELKRFNISNIPPDLPDGETVPVTIRDMGTVETAPERLSYNPNGQFIVSTTRLDYTIISSLSCRQKSYGNCTSFAWGPDNNYATINGGSEVTVYQGFKQRGTIELPEVAKELFPGDLLVVIGSSATYFYDWNSFALIRQIDEKATQVQWCPSGELVALATATSIYILKYDVESVHEFIENNKENPDAIPSNGLEFAFNVADEVEDVAEQLLWVGDCLVFQNNNRRLNYFIGGEVNCLAILRPNEYILGYLSKANRIFCIDKDKNITSYQLQHDAVAYMAAIVREDFEEAEELLKNVPTQSKYKLAQFLQSRGLIEQALQLTTEEEHRFALAIELKRLDLAKELVAAKPSVQKWKQLGDLALQDGDIAMALEGYRLSGDINGALLIMSSTRDMEGISALGDEALQSGKANVAFTCFHLTQRYKDCVQLLRQAGKNAEAAFYARTYCPNFIEEVVQEWKENPAITARIREAIANPEAYPNLFPMLGEN
eukprot:gene10656-7403_t